MNRAAARRATFTLVLIVCVAAFFWQRERVLHSRRQARLDKARAVAAEMNPAELSAALDELAPLLVDHKDGEASALAAAWEIERWRVHRDPSAEAWARALLKVAEASDARTEERYAARAEALTAHGQMSEAEEILLTQRRVGLEGPSMSVALAHAEERLGKFAAAREELRRAQTLYLRNARIKVAYGEELVASNLPADAVAVLEPAAREYPRVLQLRVDLVLARLYARDHLTAAWSDLQSLLQRDSELSPGLRARVRTAQAELELAKGNADAALQQCVAALAENPDEPLALFAHARAIALQHDAAALPALLALGQKSALPLVYLEGSRWLEEHGDAAGSLKLRQAVPFSTVR